jgi:8-oxo-dGTP diphosphatase
MFCQVAAGVFKKEDKYLVQQRPSDSKYYPNKWEFPGGKVKENERHVIDALIREWQEELGVEPEIGRMLGAGFDVKIDEDFSMDFFFISITGTNIEPIPQEGQELAWMTLDQIETLDCAPMMYYVLERLKLEI